MIVSMFRCGLEPRGDLLQVGVTCGLGMVVDYHWWELLQLQV